MTSTESPLEALRARMARNETSPRLEMEGALRHANANLSRNTYLALDAKRALHEADALEAQFPHTDRRPPLYGVPISIKDCFDVAGMATSCGSRYYATQHPPALTDAALVRELRHAGTVLTGKTHLHQVAYGITGENPDYGDCAQPCPQPADARLLTGGSSSGAAASVQEGSALVAIGTDTGGSVRVPAALCGLAGYRASYGIGPWQGGRHLAPSFDTIGMLFRDLRDGPLLAGAIFHLPSERRPLGPVHIGFADDAFLYDCTPEVLATYTAWKTALGNAGAELAPMDTAEWADAMEIFAGIQAHEAAEIHRGNFAHFEESIAARLAWGASLSEEVVQGLRQRHGVFRQRMHDLFARFQFLIVPCAPMATLALGADHSKTRGTILRYTAPISLAGLPVVTLSAGPVGAPYGAGVQLVGAPNKDAALLAYAAHLANSIANRA
ncbi:MAG: amidase [Acidobacteriaceae bacterium]